jgi:hypothetical protein
VIEILGLDTLFAEMVTGLGLALLAGNLFAWWKHRRGDRPPGSDGVYRSGRVRFLLVVGALMTVWGVASMASEGGPASALNRVLW